MEKNKVPNYLLPYLTLTFLIFIVGFTVTFNGQIQGPLKSIFLEESGNLKNLLATLISFFFFTGFSLSALLSSKWIDRYGYQRPLMRGFVVMIVALLLYCFSAYITDNYDDLYFHIGDGIVPYGYIIFLIGSFFIGSSVSLMQTVITPYVMACNIPNTSSIQRVNITSAAHSLGTSIAPFLVVAIIFTSTVSEGFDANKLMKDFFMMALFVAVLRGVFGLIRLPDIESIRSVNPDENTRSVWSFRHLKLGVIAIFFFVGAEMAIGLNINLHAMELEKLGNVFLFFGKSKLYIWGINFTIPALLATLYWTGMMMGRIISGFLNNISARIQLVFSSISALILVVIAIMIDNLWVLSSVGLFHSVMWGCIFTLAMNGLSKYTSKATGVYMLGVFGGALFPTLQGLLADLFGSWRWTWSIVIICHLVVLYYALYGSINKEKTGQR